LQISAIFREKAVRLVDVLRRAPEIARGRSARR
jgi:hypothetical protein